MTGGGLSVWGATLCNYSPESSRAAKILGFGLTRLMKHSQFVRTETSACMAPEQFGDGAGFSADLWLGMWGPAKLPRDITEKLSAELAKLLTLPDVKERLAGQGMQPVGSTPAQFAEFVRSENAQWSKVVKAAGVKAE